MDSLTNIYNRRTFFLKVEDEITRTKRYDRPLSFILLDVDYFKNINDTYGHQAGDLVLEELSNTLKLCIRPNDFLGRYGGEEFFICLPETNYESAKIFAQRILKELFETKVYYEGHCISISVSEGVVEFQKEDDVKSIVQRVDKLLYDAKESGRNCIS